MGKYYEKKVYEVCRDELYSPSGWKHVAYFDNEEDAEQLRSSLPKRMKGTDYCYVCREVILTPPLVFQSYEDYNHYKNNIDNNISNMKITYLERLKKLDEQLNEVEKIKEQIKHKKFWYRKGRSITCLDLITNGSCYKEEYIKEYIEIIQANINKHLEGLKDTFVDAKVTLNEDLSLSCLSEGKQNEQLRQEITNFFKNHIYVNGGILTSLTIHEYIETTKFGLSCKEKIDILKQKKEKILKEKEEIRERLIQEKKDIIKKECENREFI